MVQGQQLGATFSAKAEGCQRTNWRGLLQYSTVFTTILSEITKIGFYVYTSKNSLSLWGCTLELDFWKSKPRMNSKASIELTEKEVQKERLAAGCSSSGCATHSWTAETRGQDKTSLTAWDCNHTLWRIKLHYLKLQCFLHRVFLVRWMCLIQLRIWTDERHKFMVQLAMNSLYTSTYR